MYPIDSRSEVFEEVEVLGIPALFTTQRVSRATVPAGMYAYDLQTDENDWTQPCMLARHIMVEHFGTVLTAVPIDLPPNGYLHLVAGDFIWGDSSERYTAREFERKYLGVASSKSHRKPHKAKPIAAVR